MNLLFSINKNYLEHLSVTLNSITRFPTPGGCHAYILNSDLDNSDIRRLDELTHHRCYLHSVSVSPDLFAGFPESKRYPRQIYYRILAASLLPDHLERILYLDADLIAINPLNDLYQRDFNGSWYIACTHVRQLLTTINNLRLGSPADSPYINSGVMLMNLTELRKYQDKDAVIYYVEQHANRLILPDQDIISALYGDKIQLVDSLIYNMSEKLLLAQNARILADPLADPLPDNLRDPLRADDEGDTQFIDIDWIRKNTAIVHYCGKNKPWNRTYHGKLDIFYKEFINK